MTDSKQLLAEALSAVDEAMDDLPDQMFDDAATRGAVPYATALLAASPRLAAVMEKGLGLDLGETEPCPTRMQPVPVPQRGDHDYGLPLVPANTLDAAWQAAEAALPEGWAFSVDRDGATCMATAWGMGHKVFGYGPTPTAALRALASALTGGRKP